ncbi:MAG: peptide ABC transporter substrate-binding protein [Woeseiaceae bacterium]|nr:peptide ABC transporter substrate-binding protein [Woeseiaceae bacterium]
MRRLLASLLLGLLAACSGEPATNAGNTLHRGTGTDPETLDAQRARSTQAAEVLRDIGEGLVVLSADGELEAGAAESWQVSDDGLVYTFRIRDSARWSNGDRLVAAHFMRGLRRLVDPQVAAFYAQSVAGILNARAISAGEMPPEMLGVATPDDSTLIIELERPVPYLLSLLTHPSTFPSHPQNDAAASDVPLLSNGAYRLLEWRPGSLLVLERNEHYWNDEATAIDRVMYHVHTEANVELNRFRAGELHVTSNVPPERFEDVRARYGEQLRVAPYLGVYYYGFNLTRAPFKDNAALREALSMAIDREVLVQQITRRGEAPAYSWVPPGVNNYEPPQLAFAGIPQRDRNAQAQRLLAQAGFGPDRPLEIELRYNTSDTQRRIALAVQSMWADTLGVRTRLVNEEFKVLLENIRDREVTEIFRASWIGDYNDAQNFLALMHSDSSSNLPGYANPAYDALLESAASQVDPQRRRLFLEEAERLLLEDHAVMPLYFYVSKHLVHPAVRGWRDNVLDYHYSRHLSLDTAP